MSSPHIPFERRNSNTALAFGLSPEFDMVLNRRTNQLKFKRVSIPPKHTEEITPYDEQIEQMIQGTYPGQDKSGIIPF